MLTEEQAIAIACKQSRPLLEIEIQWMDRVATDLSNFFEIELDRKSVGGGLGDVAERVVDHVERAKEEVLDKLQELFEGGVQANVGAQAAAAAAGPSGDSACPLGAAASQLDIAARTQRSRLSRNALVKTTEDCNGIPEGWVGKVCGQKARGCSRCTAFHLR